MTVLVTLIVHNCTEQLEKGICMKKMEYKITEAFTILEELYMLGDMEGTFYGSREALEKYGDDYKILKLLGCSAGELAEHEVARIAFMKCYAMDPIGINLMNYVTAMIANEEFELALKVLDAKLNTLSEQELGLLMQNIIEAVRIGDILLKDIPKSIMCSFQNVLIL